MVIDIVILALLKRGPSHGYYIKKDIENILQKRSRLNTNLLYPALHRLEKAEAIEKKSEAQDGKPAKHIYRITPGGKEYLHRLIEEFTDTDAAKEDEFLTRLAFFDLIDGTTRTKILRKRKSALETKLKFKTDVGSDYTAYLESPWVKAIMEFRDRQIYQELEWIEKLLIMTSKKSS